MKHELPDLATLRRTISVLRKFQGMARQFGQHAEADEWRAQALSIGRIVDARMDARRQLRDLFIPREMIAADLGLEGEP